MLKIKISLETEHENGNVETRIIFTKHVAFVEETCELFVQTEDSFSAKQIQSLLLCMDDGSQYSTWLSNILPGNVFQESSDI